MKGVTSFCILLYVTSIRSWSMDDVCEADDIECQNPQISNQGEIIYGQCYRHAALRRLPRISFLTCLKECMKTSTCSSVSYRRDWKMCDLNGNINLEVELVQEHGCFTSKISSWSRALVGKCAGHICSDGYKCVLKGDGLTCEKAYCIGKPRVVENAVLDEPFGLSRDLGHGMMYKCADGMKMSGKPFAVCRDTGIWTSLFICGEGSIVSKLKTTGESTNLPPYTPGHGVDGIKERSNMFHTTAEFEPYWWVDLGNVYKIQKVISTNRIGCGYLCDGRLRKMLIHVGDSLNTSNMVLCGQFIGNAVDAQVIETQCSSLPEGQKVKLTSVENGLHFFHLAEVEVYGFNM
ncbi:uncharacterized protein LOC134719639 [Mytilus trossulus]|uniref:uncharacterized protein LOC134719639 n=1 Tax=Mytilus trossulus TaxID=6551 RepID=UPI003005ED57